MHRFAVHIERANGTRERIETMGKTAEAARNTIYERYAGEAIRVIKTKALHKNKKDVME